MEEKNRNRWVVVFVVAVLLCVCVAVAGILAAGGLFITDRQGLGPVISGEEGLERSVPVAPGASLQVDNFAGSVEVRAGEEEEIRVVAVKRATPARDLERIEVQFEQSTQGLLIRTRRPSALSNAAVQFEITVPPGTPLDLKTGSGNVAVDGLRAEVRVETGSGSITVRDLQGNASLDTGSGGIDVEDVEGDLSLDTGSGRVHVRDLAGDLEVHTGTGSVEVVTAAGGARLDTGSGSIEYEGAPVGACRFETGSGSVVLRLPAELDARVDLETGSGTVNVQFPVGGQVTRQHVQGLIGSGEEATIEAHTGSGDIDVFQD